MATFTNTSKNSSSWTNQVKNSSSWTNNSVSSITINAGQPVGLLLTLTYSSAIDAISWTNQAKN